MKSQLIGKDPEAGKDPRQKEKGVAEDEMITQHHQRNGHESKQTLGDSEGQRSLACYSPCGHTEQNRTWLLNDNNNLLKRTEDLKINDHFQYCLFYL